MTELNLNAKYRFSIYPTSMFSGRDFEDVTVTAKVSGAIARSLGYDIDALFSQAYISLPSGTINNPDAYGYYIVRSRTGSNSVICEAWINETTIVTVTTTNLTVLVSGVDSSDAARIRDILIGAGYTAIQLTLG